MAETNVPGSIGNNAEKKGTPDSVNRRGFLRATGNVFKKGAISALLLGNAGYPEPEEPLDPMINRLASDRIPGATKPLEVLRVPGAMRGVIHIGQQHVVSDRQILRHGARQTEEDLRVTERSQRNVESVILHLKSMYGLRGVQLEGTTPAIIDRLLRLRDTYRRVVREHREEIERRRRTSPHPQGNTMDALQIRTIEARHMREYLRGAAQIGLDQAMEFTRLQDLLSEFQTAAHEEILCLRDHPDDRAQQAPLRQRREEREAAFLRQADRLWYRFQGAAIKLHFEGKIDLYPIASDAFHRENERRIENAQGTEQRRAIFDEREDEAVRMATTTMNNERVPFVATVLGDDHRFDGGPHDDNNISKWNSGHPREKIWLARIDTAL